MIMILLLRYINVQQISQSCDFLLIAATITMTDKSEDGSSNVNYRGEISTCPTNKNDSKEQASTEKNLPTITLPHKAQRGQQLLHMVA